MKRFLSLLLVLCMVFTLLPFSAFAATQSSSSAKPKFVDIKNLNSSYKTAINWAVDNGITKGVDSTHFAPNDPCTRGQVVTFIWRAAGSPAPKTTKNPFKDVKSSSPFYKAILWASENGITTGYEDGTFKPSNACTRAHVVTFLWRYDGKPTVSSSSVKLKDISKLNDDFKKAIRWAALEGITTGYEDGTFRPNNVCTRAHVVTFLYRYVQNNTVYTVKFNSNGGSAVDNQKVKTGEAAKEPKAPSKDGYVFAGWYTDSALSTEYSFSNKVDADITLYAKWIAADDNLVDDIIDLGDIQNMESNGTIEVIYDENSNVSTIDGKFSNMKVNNNEDAAELLDSASSLFDDNFEVSKSEISKRDAGDGDKVFCYSPVVEDVPVIGSQIIVSADKNGNVNGLFSTYDSAANDVDTEPTLSKEDAKSYAIDWLLNCDEVDEMLNELVTDDVSKDDLINDLMKAISADARLAIYAAADNERPVLVYKVVTEVPYNSAPEDESDDGRTLSNTIELTSIDEDDEEASEAALNLLQLSKTIYIYANGDSAGCVYDVFNNYSEWSSTVVGAKDLNNKKVWFTAQTDGSQIRFVDSSRNITTYKSKMRILDVDLFSSNVEVEYVLPGDIAKSTSKFGQMSVSRNAVSAHSNMEKVYDFYKDVLNRKSFDGRGAKIMASTNYGGFLYKNAFWSYDDQQFAFGSRGNYEAALDVVGHEFTHAVISYVVCEKLANGYILVPGLIYKNESGALNEAYADIMGEIIEGKEGADSWNIAEDSSSALRNMKSPSLYDQPEHYMHMYRGTGDNGGVHKNSGIINLAAYKMMTDTRTKDISRETWAKVFYKSLFRLSVDSKFLNARGAIYSTAKNMGFAVNQLKAINEAFDAVGIKESQTVKFVLKWGENPSDLDSHLVGPAIGGEGRFHIYYENKEYYNNGEYYSEQDSYAAELDYDDTTSYGPEITTIHTLTPGTYYFYVHDYSNRDYDNSTEMAKSGATVEVSYYQGDSIVKKTFSVNPSSSGKYWNVAKVTISNNGEVSLTKLNTYGESSKYS